MAFAALSADLRVSETSSREGRLRAGRVEEGELTFPSIVSYVLFLSDKLTVVGYLKTPNCSHFPPNSEDSAA